MALRFIYIMRNQNTINNHFLCTGDTLVKN